MRIVIRKNISMFWADFDGTVRKNGNNVQTLMTGRCRRPPSVTVVAST